jgi:hypothetical protein
MLPAGGALAGRACGFADSSTPDAQLIPAVSSPKRRFAAGEANSRGSSARAICLRKVSLLVHSARTTFGSADTPIAYRRQPAPSLYVPARFRPVGSGPA